VKFQILDKTHVAVMDGPPEHFGKDNGILLRCAEDGIFSCLCVLHGMHIVCKWAMSRSGFFRARPRRRNRSEVSLPAEFAVGAVDIPTIQCESVIFGHILAVSNHVAAAPTLFLREVPERGGVCDLVPILWPSMWQIFAFVLLFGCALTCLKPTRFCKSC